MSNMEDELCKALYSVLMAFLLGGLVLGGLAALYLSPVPMAVADGKLLVQVDPVLAGGGLLAVVLGGFVIPKWFCGWAKPELPEDPNETDPTTSSDRI